MRLMQEQQMAFEEYKKSLTEQRLKQFEACPQPDSSLGASAYPQYNARLSEPTQSIHDASLSQFNANLFPSVPQQPFYEQKDAFDSQSMISDVLIQAPPLNLMPTNIPSSTQGRNDNTPNQNSPSTIDELILFDPKLD
ncbi:hypothetical protein MXB_3976 [Myxobolus squamalis]|nr:hypothetical protein MXB_3976 [Myxobolus squamalis]